jgi:hypothetical protein
MAAREVAVAALGTVYALSGNQGVVNATLTVTLTQSWTLPTALALLAWYVFAPQCASTLAVTKRETNSWKWPLFMFTYLIALAYLGAFHHLPHRSLAWRLMDNALAKPHHLPNGQLRLWMDPEVASDPAAVCTDASSCCADREGGKKRPVKEEGPGRTWGIIYLDTAGSADRGCYDCAGFVQSIGI